ncbi:MAG: hypothetical protein Q7U74_04840, partial [Saprospiraceae bacterium]|nr:hypothetical protein [Saprospiraceae bacterium]
MLFARFLVENDLLIEPSAGVAISLQECEELAKEAKTDLWAYASRCAQKMLPQIFRPDDPVLQVHLSPEDRIRLERLLGSLDPSIFRADDSLGWVYQFWQSKRKKQVNDSGVKIGADELPAVTQLFTEHYMVLFLLHNTLGAWWTGKRLNDGSIKKQVKNAQNEDEVRRILALPGYSFDYLRLIKEEKEDITWRPAAGTFRDWPKAAKNLKVLDPCCGSGHFVVALLILMTRIRMFEEGISAKDALDLVLRDNLFGLEIDSRCTQIAVFSVALASWKFEAIGYRPLPNLNIACSGLPIGAKREEWVDLAGNDIRLKAGMER